MTSRTTGISWCEKTWNPVTGCTKISDGCKHCYAEKMAKWIALMGGKAARRYLPVIDTDTGRWTKDVRTWPEMLDVPLRRKKPTVYFVGSMTDMFHKDVPFEFLAAVFAVMAASPQHRFMLLTKRPGRMRQFFRWVTTRSENANGGNGVSPLGLCLHHAQVRCEHPTLRVTDPIRRSPWPLPNIAIGASVEHQAAADERVPILQDTPAAHRFLSCEPLLGPIVVKDWSGIDLAIIGCESGSKRRTTELRWIQDLARSVLDAQMPCDCRNPYAICTEHAPYGSALHIKQADACPDCGGQGAHVMHDHADAPRFGCHKCGGDACDHGPTEHLYRPGTGRAGHVRGKDPNEPLDIYIPGYGTRTWREDIRW